MIDCLLIGHNDIDFAKYEKMLRAMGTKLGAYRDLNLNYINYQDKPYRLLDILNHFYFENQPKDSLFHNGDFLSPAILYLGTYLNKHDYTFEYINSFNFQKEKLQRLLEREEILTIAITTTLYVSVKPLLEIIQFIKQYNPNVKIIVGGPFVYTQYLQTDVETFKFLLKSLGADYYVVNLEGEFALINIIDALKNDLRLDQIKNIVFQKGTQSFITPQSPEDNKLEENMIKWSLFPKDDVGEFVSVRTSKSCPFSCAFCGFPERAGKYRFIDVAEIERELKVLHALGTVTTISFIDDTFNVPKERFKEILRMMIKNGFEFKWNSHFRCQFADAETVELMKASGCEGVFLGIESASEQILKNMRKNVCLDHYREGIELLHQHDITTYASFIIGFPGETDETIKETINFIEETKPTFFRTQLWYCDPITPIWDEKTEYQIKGSHFNWSHATMDCERSCDWIDHIFLNTKNSIWLPQYGFEIFSLFYLQRKGMTLEQIKEMIKTFNSIIKDKLINEQDEKKYERLKEICQFA